MLVSSEEMLQRLPPVQSAFPYRVGIIGGGRAGGALAAAIPSVLAWIVARSPSKRTERRQQLPSVPIVGTLSEIAVLPDIVVVAVPDRAIAEAATALARHFGEALSGKIVLHLSGARLASELAAVEMFGAGTASAHPFTMIPTPEPSWLFGAVWGIEGNAAVLPVVEQLVRHAGGIPYRLHRITAEQKAIYHLTAVLASNVVTESIRTAMQAAETVGIPPALFLPPILRATLENALGAIASHQTPERTGPVVRADVETIERHLAALQPYPMLLRQYVFFALAMAQDTLHEDALLRVLVRYIPQPM
ncbi:MAG: oxidoreductase [Candidatus Kapaibacterium sp.]|nr:MAG: oxidoreductase [Candidatus Kapabacteria bacterium]